MHPPTALSLSLAACDSLIDEDLDLNHVPVKAGGRFRQLFQLLLVLIRDRGAAHFEFYGCLSLHIVVVEPVEAISVLLDVINVLLDLVRVGSDSLLVARNRLLIRRDVLLIGRDAFFVAFDGYNVGSDLLRGRMQARLDHRRRFWSSPSTVIVSATNLPSLS